MEVVEITREQVGLMAGEKYNDTCYFNPVLNLTGRWCISKDVVDGCTNPDFDFLKSLPLVGFERIDESNDLADVFNSNELSNNDVDNVLNTLAFRNSLGRGTIRFRGVTPTIESIDSKKSLMNQGVIILKSKT